jgi:rRNA processing protein Krr1/Pno1
MENQTQLHQFKTRIIGRKGNELFALKKEDVALILTENRVTYALGYDNKNTL